MPSLFSDRRGIELSVNFLVSVIIAIVLFGLGILFAKNLFSGGQELVDMSQEQLDAVIENMYCTESELVCVNLAGFTLPRGDKHVFGVMIRNVPTPGGPTPTDFALTIDNPIRIDKDGATVDLTPETGLEIMYAEDQFTLEANKEKRVGFLIQAKDTNQKGKYIVNIKIRRGGKDYDVTHKLYVTVV